MEVWEKINYLLEGKKMTQQEFTGTILSRGGAPYFGPSVLAFGQVYASNQAPSL
jgi:hypothetical protein